MTRRAAAAAARPARLPRSARLPFEPPHIRQAYAHLKFIPTLELTRIQHEKLKGSTSVVYAADVISMRSGNAHDLTLTPLPPCRYMTNKGERAKEMGVLVDEMISELEGVCR